MTTESTPGALPPGFELSDAVRFQTQVNELLGPVTVTQGDHDARAALLRSQASSLIYAARLSAALGCSMSDLLQIALNVAQERAAAA